MDMKNPHYILVQDFTQEWITNRDFAIGTIVDDPKFPRDWAAVPNEIFSLANFPLREKPFTGCNVPLSASDEQPVSNAPTHYVKTELQGFLKSSYMWIKERSMPDSLETRLTAETFVQRLMNHHATADFFDSSNSTLDKILPLYMVTGIKYAYDLEYWIKRDREWLRTDAPVDAHHIQDGNPGPAFRPTDWPAHEGWIPNKYVGIAYKIHKITQDQRGKIRFDVYVDTKRASYCRHDEILKLPSLPKKERGENERQLDPVSYQF